MFDLMTTTKLLLKSIQPLSITIFFEELKILQGRLNYNTFSNILIQCVGYNF